MAAPAPSGHHSSGDIFLAFSTAIANALASAGVRHLDALADSELDPLFEAVVETVEEAVLDAMICNEDMTGKDGFTIRALPRHDLVHLLKQAGKL